MLRQLVDTVTKVLAPRVDPHGLHSNASMEGFFAHLHSPAASGNPYTIVIIFCEVEKAIDPNSRIMVWVLYAPGHVPPHSAIPQPYNPKGFTSEQLSSGWKYSRAEATHTKSNIEEWKVQVQGTGTMEIEREKQRWTVHIPGNDTSGQGPLELVVETTRRTPWTDQSPISGPEGPLERLGPLLPLHWHIFSTASRAHWQLRKLKAPSEFPESSLAASEDPEDIIASGTATAHIEKNHGNGFPTAWIWAHSISPSPTSVKTLREPESLHLPREQFPVRFAVAGGRILGIEAYLVGFRDEERGIAWNFTPPFSMGLAGRGPGLKTSRSWEKRKVNLDVWDWGRWLSVEMNAPADTFVPMPGPLAKGFAPDLCHESFQAQFKITCRQRKLQFSLLRPWTLFSWDQWAWQEVSKYDIDEAALEFGGDYVGEEVRGTKVHGE